jgi:hypothetical protein
MTEAAPSPEPHAKTTGSGAGWLGRRGPAETRAALAPTAPLAGSAAGRRHPPVEGYRGRLLAPLADATLETAPPIGP